MENDIHWIQTSIYTLHNVCAVHRGLCSTPGVFSTLRNIIEYTGGVQYSEYTGRYHDECGGIMSTAGCVQYTGGYHDECGGCHEYTRGCSVHWGFHTNSIVFLITFPIFIMISSQCTEHPQCTDDIPHCTHNILPVY